MSDIFSIKRFTCYAKKVYKENSHRYPIYLVLVLSIQIVFAFIFDRGDPEGMVSTVLTFGIIPGVLFVFSEMNPLRNRHAASINNMVPVSSLEKYLFIALNTTLIFLIAYLAVFFILTLALSNIFNYGDMNSYWLGENGVFNELGSASLIMLIFIPMAIFAGTTNIGNHLLAFLIVVVIAFLLLGSLDYLPWFLSHYVFDGVLLLEPMFNGFSIYLESGETSVMYSTTPIFGKFFDWWIGHDYNLSMWAALLMTTGYFKFKERQIK